MWFGASILMRGESEQQPAEDWIWEDSIVLFDADSAEHATELAVRYGRSHEASYIAVSGDEIRWVFDRVYSVFEIDETPASGTEVYSRFLSAATAASLFVPFD
jgi:hypothetical protein